MMEEDEMMRMKMRDDDRETVREYGERLDDRFGPQLFTTLATHNITQA